MKTVTLFAATVTIAASSVMADKIITDATIGYSIYLPTDNWMRTIKTTDHHQFYDSTYSYKAQLSIVRHAYSTTDYANAKSWTRANFIAYKLCVEYSFNPFGAMLFYDTVTATQGTLWATESYATFFTLDTAIGAWSEYTRYTANSTYGYELYALGDTADMRKNIGVYSALLKLVKLPGSTPVFVLPPATGHHGTAALKPKDANAVLFDPLGRRCGGVSDRLPSRAAGLYIWPSRQNASALVK